MESSKYRSRFRIISKTGARKEDAITNREVFLSRINQQKFTSNLPHELRVLLEEEGPVYWRLGFLSRSHLFPYHIRLYHWFLEMLRTKNTYSRRYASRKNRLFTKNEKKILITFGSHLVGVFFFLFLFFINYTRTSDITRDERRKKKQIKPHLLSFLFVVECLILTKQASITA